MDINKISIIMPFKNESLHLEKAIESIINQSERNFELIAIDDHSTDNSYDLISSDIFLKKNHKNIRHPMKHNQTDQ